MNGLENAMRIKLSHNDTNLQQKLEKKIAKKGLTENSKGTTPRVGGFRLIEELKLYRGSQQIFLEQFRSLFRS